MNVASPEVSKELYELSGWNTESHIPDGIKLEESPRYDLGYLMRKLPNGAYIRNNTRSYAANVHGSHSQKMLFKENSPEDAAAKLAIELFRSGVITRDGDE